jgi:pyruvate kinase
MLDRIARVVEPQLDPRARLAEPQSELVPATAGAISRAACALAEDVGAVAILATTSSGGTARLVARLRPARPVVGLTARPAVRRQLTLSWGVIPATTEVFAGTDAAFEVAAAWSLEQGLAQPGDRIVVTAGLPINVPGGTDLVRVIEV